MTDESVIDLESSVKLPYVRENVTLMSPGTWNGLVYSAEENNRAVALTDWTDRELNALFLDHGDAKAREWIGEIKNPKTDESGVVTGDMYVVDKATAVKLDYGAHFGISPKTGGKDIGGAMCDYSFLNFSVVFNPAVKTAYINNSQVEKKEAKLVESVIVIPQEVQKLSNLKEDTDKSQKEEHKMAEEEKKPEETKEEVSTEVKEEAAPVAPATEAKAEPAKEEPAKEEKPAEEPAKTETATDELSDTLKAIVSKVDKIYDAVAKLSEAKPAEPEKKEAETTQKMTEIEKKLEEPAPDKLGKKATEPAEAVKKLSAEEMTNALDEQMAVMMLRKQETGGIQ